MDIEKALLLPWWHAMSVPPDLQQIIIPISALPFIWHYCLWKGAWSVAVTSFIYGCVGAHFLKLAPFRWELCSGCAWLCSVVGKGWGTARVVCAPTASESFMQPFSHTFAQDLLAGHCLTMHSCSYGTTLNGDMRLLRRATMPRKTETPQPGSQWLGDQQIWVVTVIYCSTQLQALVLGEGASSLEAFLGQKSGWPVPLRAAAHGEL